MANYRIPYGKIIITDWFGLITDWCRSGNLTIVNKSWPRPTTIAEWTLNTPVLHKHNYSYRRRLVEYD